ncbi:methyltransferase domain-containing protein [Halosimplex pelagicum]|uniref:tRNA (guanine(10)-N(2))-dimethyltransferase n=1 Tax=Halosimplex pelagicum TaxID=869886 RepID=A0A7D5PDA1_9EURY|nr:methyltransferase domain-containing protein [Halosimplex pelagicum]QLH80640.1 methyltransferase domain-containing protein [Halosimplex pelagicum]
MYVLELGGQDDDFAACEAASAAAGVEVVGAGLATARAVTDRVRELAFVHRASEVVGHCDPDAASARALLNASTVDREGTVAVRAVDVRATTGVDTQRVERELGQVLVDRGFPVDLDDPDHELRALFAGPPGAESTAENAEPADGSDTDGTGVCVLGWLTAESERGFGDRRPTDRPFFQPGSMDPMLARALVNIAGAREGATVVDPMCGTGGLLLEAGLVGARAVGSDAQAKMARGTRANLRDALGDDCDFAVCRGDVTRLPFADGFADAAVFDVPYGRQSKIEGDSLSDLVGSALAEAQRVASRAVVVADRSWEREAADAGWTVEEHFERRVHRSLVRHVLVLAAED